MPVVINNGAFKEVDDKDVDYELVSPSQQFSTHINMIPVQSAVQAPRLFYGARFFNQAMPIENGESPLVQNVDAMDKDQKSFDSLMGRDLGAVFSDAEGEVLSVKPNEIKMKLPDGTRKSYPLYNNFPFNRKSANHNTALVKKGQKIKKGDILAKSNFTNDDGEMAMGLNAKIAVVPYKGYSMDDAIVISDKFADRLKSEHVNTHEVETNREIKVGMNHFKSLFPKAFKKSQLETMDDQGVVKPGTILQEGDPLVLATRPRFVSSMGASSGKLTKAISQARGDASLRWDHEYPAEVVDVHHNRGGIKVVTKAYAPTKKGDKIVLRSGQKGIVSSILPSDRMPRGSDGEAFDVLLNPLSIPSRANASLPYEILLGKIAMKTGKKVKVPGFTQPGEKWYEKVLGMLDEAGVSPVDDVYDPAEDRVLDRPVLTGSSYVMKLHHMAESKASSRGQGSYDMWKQPAKGSSESAQSKRLSGLENQVLLSSGAYNTLREGSTLRGQQDDEYWRNLRSGLATKKPGVPFAWEKTMNLLRGAGINPRDEDGGKMRLGPMRDKDLDALKPVEVDKGELINLSTMSPVEGGLFDKRLVGNNSWGSISLPFSIPNPSYEEAIRSLLGLKKKEFQDIMAGKAELPEHLR